ncbi:hypothetical protein [Klebsiella aerogenes]|uniref:hypothetical protein n=1 Tax=Klebsiella aerogenes TaxID=548 RepID=UPI001BCBC915|nr:hypothetical protein [Klebsiella aerogenes]HCR0139485.1 hypothetical protein [Klebsiella aerogenes]HED4103637.1 hypothetical protein [Klebsiella aerogenes]
MDYNYGPITVTMLGGGRPDVIGIYFEGVSNFRAELLGASGMGTGIVLKDTNNGEISNITTDNCTTGLSMTNCSYNNIKIFSHDNSNIIERGSILPATEGISHIITTYLNAKGYVK